MEEVLKAISFKFKPYLREYLNALAKKSIEDTEYLKNSRCPPACPACCAIQIKGVDMYNSEFEGIAFELLTKDEVFNDLVHCIKESKQEIIDFFDKQRENPDKEFVSVNPKNFNRGFSENLSKISHLEPNTIEYLAKELGLNPKQVKNELKKGLETGDCDKNVKAEFYLASDTLASSQGNFYRMFFDVIKSISEASGLDACFFETKVNKLDEALKVKQGLEKLTDENECVNIFDSLSKTFDSIKQKIENCYKEKADDALNLMSDGIAEFLDFVNKSNNELNNEIKNIKNPIPSKEEILRAYDSIENRVMNTSAQEIKKLFDNNASFNSPVNRIVLYTIQRMMLENHETAKANGFDFFTDNNQIASLFFQMCPFYYGKCAVYDFKEFPENCRDFHCGENFGKGNNAEKIYLNFKEKYFSELFNGRNIKTMIKWNEELKSAIRE